MNAGAPLLLERKTKSRPSSIGLLLQRKCACGGSSAGLGECEECNKKQLSLQRSTQTSELETRNLGGTPLFVHEVLDSRRADDAQTPTFKEPRFGHDFSKVSVHAMSGPVNLGTLEFHEEAPAVFDENGNEMAGATGFPGTPGTEGSETPMSPLQPGLGKQQQAPPPSNASAPGLILTGPRTMWYFSGESPASYAVSADVRSNATRGTFNWSVTPELSLSANNVPGPTVTTAARSTVLKDARIRLAHTNASGTIRRAAYELTVRAPHSLTPTGITNNEIPRGWQSLVGYSIQDQFGTTLPSSVEVNEIFDSAAIADFVDTNWVAGAQGHCLVNPSGWADNISEGDAVPPSLIPTPTAPGTGGPQVDHWPGHWQVGSPTIGSGTRVRSVTWRRFQDHGDHL